MPMQNDLIIGRDIIVVGQQPWDVSIGSNCKNIAIEFSKHNRVLYVNAALDRATLLRNSKDEKIIRRKNVIAGKENGLLEIGDNLWNLYPDVMLESAVWISNSHLFNFINKINNKRFAASIGRAIKTLGFKDVLLFNDNDIYKSFYLTDLLEPAFSIYYSRDYMLAVDYWKRHGEKLEPQLIAKSSICVANSTYLADYCKQYNPLSFYVGQGCELDMFNPAHDLPTPPDIAGLKAPIIGYVGVLQTFRLDLNILTYIAKQRPAWTLVLVGPEDDNFKNSELHKLSNVIFTGPKKPDELPAYLNSFNLCLNPQVLNEVTIGNYPRKIDEYLAMGKPVVATKTRAMEIFAEYVLLAENKEEYVSMIEKLLAEDNDTLHEQRRNFALSHSWENSVQAIYQAILHSNKF